MCLTVRHIFSYISQSQPHSPIQAERRNIMYFTNGEHRAFESLMRDKPGDHYDSGADGPFPECRNCRCHRPQWKDRYCKYAECPYTPGRMTAINKGNPPGNGGEAAP